MTLLTAAWDVVRDCHCHARAAAGLPPVPAAVRRRPGSWRWCRGPPPNATCGPCWASATSPGRTPSRPTAGGSSDHAIADPAESHLEQRFRQLFVARLRAMSASVTEVPWRLGQRRAGHAARVGRRNGRLTPQVNLENSRPDFVLESTDTAVPSVAIFVDGATFHASPSANRLADDAAKRAVLREAGHVVLSVTSSDVDVAESGHSPDAAWYSAAVRPAVITRFPATQRAYDESRKLPIDWLAGWMQDPEVDQRRLAARGLPLFMARPSVTVSVAPDLPLDAVGRHLLDGTAPPGGTRPVQVQHTGPLVTLVAPDPQGRMVVAMVLDDRPAALAADGHRVAWRNWLARANALALRHWPTIVTVFSLVGAVGAGMVDVGLEAAKQVPEPWRRAWSAAGTDAERRLLQALSSRPGIPVPRGRTRRARGHSAGHCLAPAAGGGRGRRDAARRSSGSRVRRVAGPAARSRYRRGRPRRGHRPQGGLMPTLIMTALANRMDGSIKAKAMTFLQKLSVDDTTSGLHIEKINGSADPKARTGRVDKFWRAVLFRIDTKGDRAYVVHGVWPHDDAIAEARRTVLRINPINGLPEFEKVEPAAPASPPAWTPEVPPTSDSTEPFLTRLGVSRDDLVDRLGLPAAVADAAMAAADEDAVLAIAEQHEGWVGLLLVDVAAGEPIDEIAKRLDLEMASKSGDENEDLIESFNRPAARAQFTFIDDQEELRRVIEAGDFGAWRVFLHPEQRKYVERRYNGPFRLSGGARHRQDGRRRPPGPRPEPGASGRTGSC